MHFAKGSVMKDRTRAVGRRLVVYALTVAVGLAGGRVLAAAWMFKELGWTATWLEISHWGPSYNSEPISRTHISSNS